MIGFWVLGVEFLGFGVCWCLVGWGFSLGYVLGLLLRVVMLLWLLVFWWFVFKWCVGWLLCCFVGGGFFSGGFCVEFGLMVVF